MNVKLKGKLRYFLSICATYLEILLSAILAVALLICAVQMIPPLFSLEINGDTEIFHNFLEDIFTLILGVEALKMLCKHSTGAVIEVLMFTMAREMVVHETTPQQNLLVIISVAILFFVRKYLFVPTFGQPHGHHDHDMEGTGYDVHLNSQRASMLDPDSESGLHTHYQHLEDEQEHTAAH